MDKNSLEKYSEAFVAGDDSAAAALAFHYMGMDGEPADELDYELAFRLASLAHCEGYAEGTYALAIIYFDGQYKDNTDRYLAILLLESIKDSYAPAAQALESIHQNYPEAFKIEAPKRGYWNMNGHARSDAINYCTLLARAGDTEAKRKLWKMLWNRLPDKALFWLESAAADDDPESCYKLSLVRTHEKKHTEAFNLMSKSARADYIPAYLQFAYMIWFGRGALFGPSCDLARKWFSKAIYYGNPETNDSLYADFFAERLSDYNKALEMFNHGYNSGDEQEYRQAIKLLEKAFDGGNGIRDAGIVLGNDMMQEYGRNRSNVFAKAAQTYRDSAVYCNRATINCYIRWAEMADYACNGGSILDRMHDLEWNYLTLYGDSDYVKGCLNQYNALYDLADRCFSACRNPDLPAAGKRIMLPLIPHIRRGSTIPDSVLVQCTERINRMRETPGHNFQNDMFVIEYNTVLHIVKGSSLVPASELRDCIKDLKTMLMNNPFLHDALRILGELMLTLGDEAQARKYLQNAVYLGDLEAYCICRDGNWLGRSF